MKAFDRLTHIERWVRLATGFIFILAGIYCSLFYVYELPIKIWCQRHFFPTHLMCEQ